MFEQPVNFCAESDALYEILAPLSDSDFDQPGQFKGWTINDILGHLHTWNVAADAGLNDVPTFNTMRTQLEAALRAGQTILAFEKAWRRGVAGRALLQAWHGFYTEMSARFAMADPKHRVKWVGPDMSVRSSITARHMETWAHSQAIYDMLGLQRSDADRIKDIAMLGINTFGWCFSIRGLRVPDAPPHVRLTLPSGAIWQWFAESEENLIEGSATEFCQVTTQVRNISDTNLKLHGPTATQWMAIAQCFAGPPENPPASGSRFMQTV